MVFCRYAHRWGVGLHFPINPIFTKCPYLFHPYVTLKFSVSDIKTPYKIVSNQHTIHVFTQNQFGTMFGKTTYLQRKPNFQTIIFVLKYPKIIP